MRHAQVSVQCAFRPEKRQKKRAGQEPGSPKVISLRLAGDYIQLGLGSFAPSSTTPSVMVKPLRLSLADWMQR